MGETCRTCRSNFRLFRIATGAMFFLILWRGLNSAFFDAPTWLDYVAAVAGAFVGNLIFISEHKPNDGATHG